MRTFCRLLRFGGVLALGAFLVGCELDGGSYRLVWTNTELSLVDVTDAASYSRSLGGSARSIATRGKPVPGNLKILLRAQVAPPRAPDGTMMQASHIALSPDGKTAFVVYMLQGSEFYGGLDVIDVSRPASARILTSREFPDGDIGAVVYDGSTLYLGGSKIDPDGDNAWVVAVPYSRGKLGTQRETHLPGYFATALDVSGVSLFVTTGTNSGDVGAGLFVLDASTLEVTTLDTTGLDDLRSVAIAADAPLAFTAQWPTAAPLSDPKVRFYADAALAGPTDLNLTGYTAQAEAKSWMESIGAYLYVACNLSGVAVVDPGLKSVVASIPAPDLNVAIVPRDAQSSNAVSQGTGSGKTLYFIANGEAGLWVGDTAEVLDTLGTPGHGVAGSIRFGPGESVNFVAGKNSVVVAAAGIGGVKVMELTP